MHRRSFLIGSSACLVIGVPTFTQLGVVAKQNVLVSSASDIDGNHYVVATHVNGQIVSQTRLPKRGHDTLALPHKAGHVLVLARRPDRFAMEINVLEGKVTRVFEAQRGHHFYGHGELSSDGRFLYTSENDYENNRGVITVRETEHYQTLSQFDSGGIGPHDIKLMPDGLHLAIANGGISTHPDWPRMKLNVDTMQPNLSLVNLNTGRVQRQYTPPHHQLSLRHLDVNHNGDIYVGAQFQGDYSKQYPLVFVQSGNQQLQALHASEEDWRAMRQYTASVCVDKERLLVTCPRGDLLTFWNTSSGKLERKVELKDAAGVAAIEGEFIVSSGHGRLLKTHGQQTEKQTLVEGVRFDNHMTLV
jgi:hypothetical protein